MIRLASIIERFGGEYLAQYATRVLPSQRKALAAMKLCRSTQGPGMLAQCGDCGEQRLVPHSCGHRNCPHCQHFESQRWIERQTKALVPGQQVVQDVVDDGAVNILGRPYSVPPHIVEAIRSYPERYLMGHIGPDVFPDPIVGQTTVHPGVERGWQTDQWLQHLLRSASSAEEVAFAYGFAGHAGGDIFAHTYVNAYAGSIFELTNKNSGAEVERRHFVLEKYIRG